MNLKNNNKEYFKIKEKKLSQSKLYFIISRNYD